MKIVNFKPNNLEYKSMLALYTEEDLMKYAELYNVFVSNDFGFFTEN